MDNLTDPSIKMDNLTAKPLPVYRCHKQVRALQIKAILNPNEALPTDDGERVLTFSDPGYEACVFIVTAEYMQSHKPKVGGYYVEYADGYRSWSPKDAFEQGYTRIEVTTPHWSGH